MFVFSPPFSVLSLFSDLFFSKVIYGMGGGSYFMG